MKSEQVVQSRYIGVNGGVISAIEPASSPAQLVVIVTIRWMTPWGLYIRHQKLYIINYFENRSCISQNLTAKNVYDVINKYVCFYKNCTYILLRQLFSVNDGK